jgi:hypothetical protein
LVVLARSSALIKEARRTFGADNTGGWHWHPFEEPDSHVAIAEAVAFDEFLGRIEEQLER